MIGLGTYAYFWRHSDRVDQPMSLIDAFRDTRALGVELFQICDYAPLLTMSAGETAEAAAVARDLGLVIQLGTKGVMPDHLDTVLRRAAVFEARLVRSMLYAPESRPSLPEAERMLRTALRAYESAGVTLALETYEQVATDDLVGLIEQIGSDHLGICLDPANVVARLETPRAAVERCAPVTRNVHVKDFAFARQDGWVGFTYSGAPMGTGLHDYPHLVETVRPRERGIDEIVEHWLPWQGDPETTVRTERDWTRTTLEYLRSTT
ncbi:sugar phosphate isomerase/epimerase family protein [Microbacterium deminutum]|uniref:TIM barrel protein n=1 Tax=Microbacterium deminutum TaxID=344164 RepID=A0ABP5C502_9MICO